jgi:ubiquitin carboxyl-terminal hydrolase 1
MYELRAVVTHWGQHDTGHYVCYRKHPVSSPPAVMTSEETEKHVESASGENDASGSMDLDGETGPALEVDDTKSDQDESPNQDQASQWWRLSDEDVWQVDEQTVLSQGGVFMLFYDCVDPNSVLVSDLDTSTATEQAAEGPNVSNGVLTPLRVAPGPDTVQQNDGASTESVDLMQLDDALPLPGTSTQPDAVPDSPKMGEMGDEQEDASRNAHTPIESHTRTAWDSEPAQDRDQSQGLTDSMGQPMDECLALPSLSRVSEV